MPKPKPFQRQSIDITPPGAVWQDILADEVAPGDVVAGYGKIATVSGLIDVGHGVVDDVVITNVMGDRFVVYWDTGLHVFGPQR